MVDSLRSHQADGKTGKPGLKLAYDVFSLVITHIAMDYMCGVFLMLTWEDSIRLWNSFYWYASRRPLPFAAGIRVVLFALLMLAFAVMPGGLCWCFFSRARSWCRLVHVVTLAGLIYFNTIGKRRVPRTSATAAGGDKKKQ